MHMHSLPHSMVTYNIQIINKKQGCGGPSLKYMNLTLWLLMLHEPYNPL